LVVHSVLLGKGVISKLQLPRSKPNEQLPENSYLLDAITKRLFAAHEVKTSMSSVDRFYARHKISFKKSLHASEQQRPDVAEAHENWKMA